MAITIPNTFVAGTKIEAAPVNANFAEVANAVDKRGDTITGNLSANAGVTVDGVDLSTIPNIAGTFNPLFPQVVIGTADTNGIRLDLESGTLAVREGDDSAYGPLIASIVNLPSGGSVNFASGDVTITHSTNTLTFAGAASGYIFNDGNVGIGGTPGSVRLDLIGALNAIRVSDVTTDTTTKQGKWLQRHYTNAEEDAMVAFTLSTSTDNLILIGGGSGAQNAATQISFYTAANNTTTTGTERMRIPAAGGVQCVTTLSVGNATPAATGAGITFPASQSSSSDANTFDDYEEGTFTPAISGTSTAGVGTYAANAQNGHYTKKGREVTCTMYLEWTAHTGTGNMRITGLPFTSLSTPGTLHAASIGYVNNIAMTAGNILTGYMAAGSTQILLQQTPTGGGASVDVPIDTAGGLVVTVTYFTAT